MAPNPAGRRLSTRCSCTCGLWPAPWKMSLVVARCSGVPAARSLQPATATAPLARGFLASCTSVFLHLFPSQTTHIHLTHSFLSTTCNPVPLRPHGLDKPLAPDRRKTLSRSFFQVAVHSFKTTSLNHSDHNHSSASADLDTSQLHQRVLPIGTARREPSISYMLICLQNVIPVLPYPDVAAQSRPSQPVMVAVVPSQKAAQTIRLDQVQEHLSEEYLMHLPAGQNNHRY